MEKNVACKFFKSNTLKVFVLTIYFALSANIFLLAQINLSNDNNSIRQHISIDNDWRFFIYDSAKNADSLIYDVRPLINENNEYKIADAKPTDAVKIESNREVLKPWILPTGNSFINDTLKQHIRPEGNPGSNFKFVKSSFDDSSWEKVNLPHDWAIKAAVPKRLEYRSRRRYGTFTQ